MRRDRRGDLFSPTRAGHALATILFGGILWPAARRTLPILADRACRRSATRLQPVAVPLITISIASAVMPSHWVPENVITPSSSPQNPRALTGWRKATRAQSNTVNAEYARPQATSTQRTGLFGASWCAIV